MSGIHNLKPERVVKAFERAGWKFDRQAGSHKILTKEGSSVILSIPVHKGRPLKQGLLKHLISSAGLTVDEFLRLYK